MDAAVPDIGRILMEGLESQPEYRIPYGQPGEKLSPPPAAPAPDHDPGRLSELCKEMGLPLLSVVVVNQDTLMPGPGFFKYFFGTAEEMKRMELFVEAYHKALDCEDRSPLRQKPGPDLRPRAAAGPAG